MAAYYNEFDPYAAQWLRNLIAAGHIAPGDVDERSIVDVKPDDLKGYTQCHFFAGIGGWSYAARLVGWADERAMWSASCPCQPYSLAGKGLGQEDERDLWPVLYRLIDAVRPAVLVGEQVKDAIGKHWLDRMRFDLEKSGYTIGATVLPACSVDAPHGRDRLWFVAEPDCCLCDGRTILSERGQERGASSRRLSEGHFGWSLANPDQSREGEGRQQRGGELCGIGGNSRGSYWVNSEWAVASDGKARRVEPSIRLLAHGVPARVGKLRAYGNAIVPQVAAEVIGAYMDCQP